MSIADILRSAVATANGVTSSLQSSVSHAAYSGLDSYGAPTYGTPVTRSAIVDSTRRLYRTRDGRELLQRAAITFLVPIALDPRDRITLQDGTTGPILDTSGTVDPATGQPYAVEVILG